MTPRVQVRLTASRGSESRHLWLYAGHVGPVAGEPIAGDVIDVLTPDGRFYARGLYNPASKIRVRLLTFHDEPIDETFWRGAGGPDGGPGAIADALFNRWILAFEVTGILLLGATLGAVVLTKRRLT